MDIVKANNALVSTVEFYASAVGSLLVQLKEKDSVIEQLGKQLREQQVWLKANDEFLARCSVGGRVTVPPVVTGTTGNPAVMDDDEGSGA